MVMDAWHAERTESGGMMHPRPPTPPTHTHTHTHTHLLAAPWLSTRHASRWAGPRRWRPVRGPPPGLRTPHTTGGSCQRRRVVASQKGGGGGAGWAGGRLRGLPPCAKHERASLLLQAADARPATQRVGKQLAHSVQAVLLGRGLWAQPGGAGRPAAPPTGSMQCIPARVGGCASGCSPPMLLGVLLGPVCVPSSHRGHLHVRQPPGGPDEGVGGHLRGLPSRERCRPGSRDAGLAITAAAHPHSPYWRPGCLRELHRRPWAPPAAPGRARTWQPVPPAPMRPGPASSPTPPC